MIALSSPGAIVDVRLPLLWTFPKHHRHSGFLGTIPYVLPHYASKGAVDRILAVLLEGACGLAQLQTVVRPSRTSSPVLFARRQMARCMSLHPDAGFLVPK